MGHVNFNHTHAQCIVPFLEQLPLVALYQPAIRWACETLNASAPVANPEGGING